LTGTECSFNICAGQKVPGLDADIRITATSLVVAVIQYFVQAAIEFKGDAFAKFIYVDHTCTFLVLSEMLLKRRDYTTTEQQLESRDYGPFSQDLPVNLALILENPD
jgi:hypothetical protein